MNIIKKPFKLDDINRNDIYKHYDSVNKWDPKIIPLHIRIRFFINYLKKLGECVRRYPDNMFIIDSYVSEEERKTHSVIKVLNFNKEQNYMTRDRCNLIYSEHECDFRLEVKETYIPKFFSITNDETIYIVRFFYGQLRKIRDSFMKLSTSLTWNRYEKLCINQGKVWETIWHTVCNNLPRNPLWLYRYRVEFIGGIEITQGSCGDCGDCPLYKNTIFDHQIPISKSVSPHFDLNCNPHSQSEIGYHKCNVIINETLNSNEIIVSSLENAMSIKKYYSEKLCSNMNMCGENYFIKYDFAKLITFWNYAVQMFSFIKELNEQFITLYEDLSEYTLYEDLSEYTETISVTISFRDCIEMKYST